MNYSNESVCTIVVVHNPEMPDSENLKTGDSFFCIPPSPHKHNSIQSLIGLGHYMISYMRYTTITISFYYCNEEIIFVSYEVREKMLQKPNFESKEIRILGKNGINSKLKYRKAHNRFYPGDLVTCTGGDCCRIRESWR